MRMGDSGFSCLAPGGPPLELRVLLLGRKETGVSQVCGGVTESGFTYSLGAFPGSLIEQVDLTLRGRVSHMVSHRAGWGPALGSWCSPLTCFLRWL